MKIAHWSLTNGSGLHRVAEDYVRIEKEMGHESFLVGTDITQDFSVIDADIHVVHSCIPDKLLLTRKIKKMVYVLHGTPEHCFQSSVESGLNQGYGASDPFMMLMQYVRVADVTVTNWQRHADMLKTMSDKHTRIEVVPMGIDTSIFKPVESRGKFAGTPSVLTAENCHYIKWPLDLFILWPWVSKEIPEAVLHAQYLPRDQHRWFMPLIMRNGTAYKSYISGVPMAKDDLINAFSSVDFYAGLVRYGDHNRICMEAKACGCKVISYAGNEYADFWVPEGDQRVIAAELVKILKGEVEPRTALPTHDIRETVARMVEIYGSL